MRTDDDRRRELKLSGLRFECDRIAHERNLLQIRLAGAITTHRGGWRAPEAVTLKREIAGKAAEWSRLNEQVRAILQEDT
jgi:hypothetical protein